MKGLTQWGHNGKGFYYGLRLHLTADFKRQILSIKFTAANVDDREMFMPLNKD